VQPGHLDNVRQSRTSGEQGLGAAHGTALSALAALPATEVRNIARLVGVLSLSPNRQAARRQRAAGGRSVARRGEGKGPRDDRKLRYSGKGVGIAVLDTGVMAEHRNFQGATPDTPNGASVKGSRVVASVDLVRAPRDEWQLGVDTSSDTATACYRANTRAANADAFGHGTHAASVAAGDGSYSKDLDSSGMAPDAHIFDVRVLDQWGAGRIEDVLSGIDCVIRRAPELRVRVMNMSLASDSTESYLTHPLCRAVRIAMAGRGSRSWSQRATSARGATCRAGSRRSTAASAPRYRPFRDHGGLRELAQHGFAQRRQGQPLQLARLDARPRPHASGHAGSDNLAQA
jgi:subtilisin family serine protease